MPERAVGDPPTREARRAPSPYNPAPRAAPPEVASFEPTKPGPEGADWMRPATSVELDRVRASGREWIYGWLERPVPPGTVVVGTAGRFVRA
ncbi:MAG: hypothetical protein F4Z28_09420, partial [Gammaproteobacteria bacterium]|nr:hypothetical protein [Gammaproteobacteria bacterium]